MKIIEESYAWRLGAVFSPQQPDTIVIHHALAKKCTAQDIHKWHIDRGWQGIAYHYFIAKGGKIYRGRKEGQQGGHLYGDQNRNTLGICLEGCYEDYKDQTDKVVPEAQLIALIELCKDIMKRWNIPVFQVKPHNVYNSAKKCPGDYFPWKRLIDSLTIAEYQREIQKNCRFSYPEGVWAVLNTHPHASDLYKKWADSYKTPG